MLDRFPYTLKGGYFTYFLIGANKDRSSALYEYRNYRMGGRQFIVLSATGEHGASKYDKPSGYSRRYLLEHER